MPDELTILLPPSEGKAPGGDLPGWDPASGRFGAELAADRTRVARALATARGGDQGLLGVKGDALDRARAANRSIIGGACLPAWRRYTGVVWDNLDVASLPPVARARAAESVLVVSAVAGLVGLDDPLPDHRLKLSVSLGRLGRVARFWQPTLTSALNDHLAGRLVVDLLPQEHAAAWVPAPERYDLCRVRLIGRDGRAAGHAAKAAKGQLARALVRSRSPRRELQRWHHDDFTLVVERSG